MSSPIMRCAIIMVLALAMVSTRLAASPLAVLDMRQEHGRPSYAGEPITLNFQDIEVRAVLAIIAEVTGLNLVASDSVQGRVTLNLTDVPWDQALDLVLRSHGLASRREGSVVMVAPAAELVQHEQWELQTREQIGALLPLTTEYVQVRYARAVDLAALLRGGEGFGLLTERGRVAVDERTNMLLIQDTAAQVEIIRHTLERLDVAVRQVQIEARIVIASDSASRELGVNWGISSNRGTRADGSPRRGFNLGGAASGGDPRQAWFDPVEGEPVWRSRGGLAVDLGGDGRSPLTSFAFGYLSGDILLDLELRALESEGKSYTISQPRVITANQRTAVIKQGQERAYQEAAASGAAAVEFKEAVLSLEVTPQITPDNRIIMDVAITNDTFGEFGAGEEPPVNKSEIQTQVLVDNGETVVLGGILQTEELRHLARTPFLGDLPVLGNLFRYTQQSNEKVELL